MNIERVDQICLQLIKHAGEKLRESFKAQLTVDTKEY